MNLIKSGSLACVLIAGLILSPGCSRVFHLSNVNSQNYRITEKADLFQDTDLEGVIAPYRDQLGAKMNDTIGFISHMLVKKQPESDLGNWVTDIILDYTEKQTGDTYDFSIANYGGLRIPALAAGPVTVGKLYELMPFDNMIVILHAKGEIVRMLFDKMADRGGWPISRNVKYQIIDGEARDILIKGEPLADHKIYQVVIPDFIANGGDNCFFLKNVDRTDPQILYREALIESIKMLTVAGKEITAKIENRVRIN